MRSCKIRPMGPTESNAGIHKANAEKFNNDKRQPSLKSRMWYTTEVQLGLLQSFPVLKRMYLSLGQPTDLIRAP
ncbi:hypothetical protein DPMN_173575 [Dreissena polymorpha]|uniref:Uncharacterized protein n=1 Tax=Dreissena polymorpha TaxID=45954 RepID=A0A9D4IH23_DREPO|nr:hypothetical protein DPMN_173575 [Dreissena polymorpha]